MRKWLTPSGPAMSTKSFSEFLFDSCILARHVSTTLHEKSIQKKEVENPCHVSITLHVEIHWRTSSGGIETPCHVSTILHLECTLENILRRNRELLPRQHHPRSQLHLKNPPETQKTLDGVARVFFPPSQYTKIITGGTDNPCRVITTLHHNHPKNSPEPQTIPFVGLTNPNSQTLQQPPPTAPA